MMHILIGHRGTGKTSLVHNCKQTYPQSECIDLDQYIAKAEQLSIAQIFSQFGEKHFRLLEKKYFNEIYQKFSQTNKTYFVSLGAGFDFSLSEYKNTCIYFVQRASDSHSRIFIANSPTEQRPRLSNNNISEYDEYLSLYNERQNKYLKYADEILYIPEGISYTTHQISDFFATHNKWELKNSRICLSPWHFKNLEKLKNYIQKRLSWKIDFFELRDDLLNEQQISFALQNIPSQHLLLSFRTKPQNLQFCSYLKEQPNTAWDWPLELGECSFTQNYHTISLHERATHESIEQALLRLEAYSTKAKILKFAPLCLSWEELEIGHDWQIQSVERHFLPRSQTQEWQWYRLHNAQLNKIYFLAESDQNVSDQAYLLQYVLQNQNKNLKQNFAAVLGQPILHSYSPMFHRDFFNQWQMPFYAISLTKENFSTAMPVLKKIGLCAAAITSPLKEVAYNYAQEHKAKNKESHSQANSNNADKTQNSVNTFFITEAHIEAINTDQLALEKTLSAFNDYSPILIWGGGGTLNSILNILPQAIPYSARSASLRNEKQQDLLQEQLNTNKKTLLIWALGRSDFNKYKMNWPKLNFSVHQVYDLNYAENSPGREFAKLFNANYTSGIAMFEEQAKLQQNFWFKKIKDC